MPFKSKAQVRKFRAMVNQGKMTEATFQEWADATPNMKSLPERSGKLEKRAFLDSFLKIAGKITWDAARKIMVGPTDLARERFNKGYGRRMVTAATAAAKPVTALPVLKTPPILKTGAGNLPEEAAEMSRFGMQDYVPGTGLREVAETGQARGRATRTKGVQNEDREMNPKLKHTVESSKGGRHVGGMVDGLRKTSMAAGTREKIYKGLEYGGLGTLAATDAYDAYKAHKEGKKGERNKALLNTGALGALIGATRLAHK